MSGCSSSMPGPHPTGGLNAVPHSGDDGEHVGGEEVCCSLCPCLDALPGHLHVFPEHLRTGLDALPGRLDVGPDVGDDEIGNALEHCLPRLNVEGNSRDDHPDRHLDALPDGLEHRQEVGLKPIHDGADGVLDACPQGIDEVAERLALVVGDDESCYQRADSNHDQPDRVGIHGRVEQPLRGGVRARGDLTRHHGTLLRHPGRRRAADLNALLDNRLQEVPCVHGFQGHSLCEVLRLGDLRRRPGSHLTPDLGRQGDQAHGAGDGLPGDEAADHGLQNGLVLDE